MNVDEFNRIAIRTEDSASITFDVRPFGDRQSEAIDAYLTGYMSSLQAHVAPLHSRLVIVLCDPGTQLIGNSQRFLQLLNAQGRAIEIRNG